MSRATKQTVAANDLALKKAASQGANKPQTEYRIDAGRGVQVPGFVFVTRPSGTAAFYLVYRTSTGKTRKLKLAEFGPVTLAEARERALQAYQETQAGADPVGERRASREAITFRELAEQFLASGRLRENTRSAHAYALRKHVYPVIGDMPASEVTPQHVQEVCQRIEAEGRKVEQAKRAKALREGKLDLLSVREHPNEVQADRTRAAIGGCYRYGIRERLVTINPAKGIAKRAEHARPRDYSPCDSEIAALWKWTESKGATLSDPMRSIVKLAILTAQRRSEVAGARLDELLDLDGDNPRWVISTGRSKNRKAQTVPLSKQAAAIFAQAIAGARDGYVFPADSSKTKAERGKTTRVGHINGESVSRAIARGREAFGSSELTMHDLRRAAANWMIDAGIAPHIVDRVLNHVDTSVTGRHYANSAQMLPQVRAALQAWADHVWQVTGQSSNAGSNVVRLVGAG